MISEWACGVYVVEVGKGLSHHHTLHEVVDHLVLAADAPIDRGVCERKGGSGGVKTWHQTRPFESRHCLEFGGPVTGEADMLSQSSSRRTSMDWSSQQAQISAKSLEPPPLGIASAIPGDPAPQLFWAKLHTLTELQLVAEEHSPSRFRTIMRCLAAVLALAVAAHAADIGSIVMAKDGSFTFKTGVQSGAIAVASYTDQDENAKQSGFGQLTVKTTAVMGSTPVDQVRNNLLQLAW